MIDGTKKAIEAASKLASEVADTESGAVAKQELGKTALTVTRTINNVLLPLAAVNYAIEKAQDYYANRFPQELAAITEDIPVDEIREPRPSVAGPVMQGLAYSHEEEPLKEMYLRLLRSAMDSRMLNGEHPAFSEVVRQITAEEARLLPTILNSGNYQPIARIERRLKEGGKQILERVVLRYTNTSTGAAVANPQLALMVDNWCRLGLIEVDFMRHVSEISAYDWVQKRPEYLRFVPSDIGSKIEFEKGVVSITDFGREFSLAVK